MEVIQGRGPAPLFVVQLVARLPDDSLTVALLSGGRDHFGWGATRYLLAAIHDGISVNTEATGNWKKGKTPKLPRYPLPKTKKKSKKKKSRVSVRDLYNKMAR